MTERKFTDEEIIRLLQEYEVVCDECACNDGFTTGKRIMTNDLDLINRQKAEIERLEADVDKQYEQAEADILANMADGGASCHWCIAKHKAEAIKEFAERLKERKYETSDWSHGAHPYVVEEDDIDEVLEEMITKGITNQ